MSNFIIRPRRSRHFRLSLLGLFVVLLLPLIFSNQERPNAGLKLWLPRIAGGNMSAEELSNKNAELREELLILRQNSQVDKQAAALLQKQLIDTQKENFQLRKDLEFYKGIIDMQGSRNSPVIHGMRIRPLTHARGYRLELILLHITNTDKVFEGALDVVVEGEQDSAATRLPLDEISLSRNYSVRFRNFQRIENNFILPKNFQPQKIFVTVTIDDDEGFGFEEIYDWPLTENGEVADVG